MSTEFYINTDGVYLGGFSKSNSAIPNGAIRVESPPLDALMQKWNFESKSWEPDTVILKQAQDAKIAQCKAYLDKTGWQIERLCDPSSGEPLKEGVAENRSLARSLQDDIVACATIEELNAININFK